MQELQPVPGLAGRLFGGGGGPAATRQEQAAEVRCPRCDSSNTKFCYYNNYNLAQPRHFCKACRRYWTRGGHLRNVPVGGGCRKPKPRRAAADDVSGKSAPHGAHRDWKTPPARSGRSSSPSPATDGEAPVPSALSVVTEPSVPSSVAEASAGAGPLAAGDTRTLLVPPAPAPMFADQAAVFESLFAPPQPLPAFGSSAHARPEAEEDVAGSLAEQQSPASSTAARSDGALATAGASAWPTAAADAGVFELAGGTAGDASLPAYWNPGSWTDPDPTMYLP